MAESPHRSLAKAVFWRITGTVDTMAVANIMTGRLKLAMSIGSIELLTKICLYYAHERVCNRLSFGRIKPQDDYRI